MTIRIKNCRIIATSITVIRIAINIKIGKMKFYNRESEIKQLKEISRKSQLNAQLTFVTGRRRVGKTRLLKMAFQDEVFLYFFVAKKNEILLCEEFIEELKATLGITVYGEFTSFSSLFGYILEISTTQNFTLIIDEFQEFFSLNPSVYSDMQNLWDKHKEKSKLNLICCGSIYTLMHKIFMDRKEPLYGRANHMIKVNAFDTHTIKQIMSDYKADFSNDELFTLYTITGGIPKYIELIVESSDLSYEGIINYIISENSIFLDEGKNVLIDEFGKEYTNYFSILTLIASSKTARPEIESILNMSVGGFLDKLEIDFEIIKKIKPIFSKPGSRTIKYAIEDNFLDFWFRFIYKNKSAIEIKNFEYVKQIIHRDFDVFSGRKLEKYFIQHLTQDQIYSELGTYWEKDNTNEIDIVGLNKIEKKIDFYEVKKQASKISLSLLEQKSEKIVRQFDDYSINYYGLSIEDM